jgi:hypothetical protein
MTTLINFITKPYRWYIERRKFKQRIKELQERDPFIYK